MSNSTTYYFAIAAEDITGHSSSKTAEVSATPTPPAGTLDQSFDSDGLRTVQVGSGSRAFALAVQPDGKLVVAGLAYAPGQDFGLSRLNPDGSLDTSFGSGGQATSNLGADDWLLDLALQPDGKIVVAGGSGSGAGTSQVSNFALARYTSNGNLDTTFDADGKVTTDFGGLDYANAVAVQKDGKIVSVGESADYTASPATSSLVLARYNPDGSLDTTFDGDGKLIADFGGDFAEGLALLLQADGKIVAGGSRSSGPGLPSHFALARFNPDGSLDPGFDGDGRVTTDFGGNGDLILDLAAQTDGKLVAAGLGYFGPTNIPAFALARYNSDGSLDPSFDQDGKQISDCGTVCAAESVALQQDGKIVIAGYVYDTGGSSYEDFALLRYNANGSLDTTFSFDGKVTTDFGGGISEDYAQALALQADGKIVVAGWRELKGASSKTEFALARYWP